ncbi:hypothetical protein [uncultured Ferrimonas sp.]|uniref:hypothetical protein n=1 Tax=uncultured Ferrimonas sp. TaxID=432640 RepID=UPI00261884E0|nr:hypothetical protein [uncultured Ferrimonas sp.]
MITLPMLALLWGLPLAPTEQAYRGWQQQQPSVSQQGWLAISTLGTTEQRALALVIASASSNGAEARALWQQATLLLEQQQQSWPKLQRQLAQEYQSQQRWLSGGAGTQLGHNDRQRWLLMEWLVEEVGLLRYQGPPQHAVAPVPRTQITPPKYQPRWGGS